jgi:hypothetical protein
LGLDEHLMARLGERRLEQFVTAIVGLRRSDSPESPHPSAKVARKHRSNGSSGNLARVRSN